MQIAKTFHSALDSIAACHKPPDARKSTTPTTQIRCMLCIQHTRPYKFSSFIFFYFRFVSIMSLFCCMPEPRFVCHSFMLCPLVSVSSCFVVFFFLFYIGLYGFRAFIFFVLFLSLFFGRSSCSKIHFSSCTPSSRPSDSFTLVALAVIFALWVILLQHFPCLSAIFHRHPPSYAPLANTHCIRIASSSKLIVSAMLAINLVRLCLYEFSY